ncbi:class I SAM-dependent methyltransferase [Pseudorhodoplanes sinuspersici]|uniref:Uncharacterized protein n=1 Tax=Pseudorhodoplanes sinuspersici TaxID=1235591 RepID=A0A1W6ZYA8_9HYPH|nr:class I SAM-dependent methyltransferase [Pseudorhodoplanes sinuspersici]ARQ02324.1 hypothetical protein CAK95_26890 [Pseudorhodoplanes sinuspersici]RKE74153.1 tRNA (mo5U34)-methyltransferase [Pseudorhodoplanes sinuspersici]
MAVKLKKMRAWTAEEKAAISKGIEELRPWGYGVDFGEGISTRQGHEAFASFDRVLSFVPENLQGASVLDLPCNNAQLSMALKDRGAGPTLAVDYSDLVIRQAKFIAETCGYQIDTQVASIYDFDPKAPQFEYVFCLGLIYHLPDLVGAFERLQKWTRGVCFVETEVLRLDGNDPKSAFFIPGLYNADPTNWWIPGIEAVINIAKRARFKSVEVLFYQEKPRSVTREGYPLQARAIFRCINDVAALTHPSRVIRA